MNKISWHLIVFFILYMLDQLTKILAESRGEFIFHESTDTWTSIAYLSITAALLVYLLLFVFARLEMRGFNLVHMAVVVFLAGGAGNVSDIALRGSVTDFIILKTGISAWEAWTNLADFYILFGLIGATIGVILLIARNKKRFFVTA